MNPLDPTTFSRSHRTAVFYRPQASPEANGRIERVQETLAPDSVIKTDAFTIANGEVYLGEHPDLEDDSDLASFHARAAVFSSLAGYTLFVTVAEPALYLDEVLAGLQEIADDDG